MINLPKPYIINLKKYYTLFFYKILIIPTLILLTPYVAFAHQADFLNDVIVTSTPLKLLINGLIHPLIGLDHILFAFFTGMIVLSKYIFIESTDKHNKYHDLSYLNKTLIFSCCIALGFFIAILLTKSSNLNIIFQSYIFANSAVIFSLLFLTFLLVLHLYKNIQLLIWGLFCFTSFHGLTHGFDTEMHHHFIFCVGLVVSNTVLFITGGYVANHLYMYSNIINPSKELYFMKIMMKTFALMTGVFGLKLLVH